MLHGAGTGTEVPLLAGLALAMGERGWDVIRLEQPYRVQGRRAPAPAHQLDAVVRQVVTDWGGQTPLVLAGRSSGARVACRLASELAAAMVVAFGFPLISPKNVSRQHELDAAGVPVLVIQGTRDPFGMPRGSKRRRREVLRVPGADHALERSRTRPNPLGQILVEVAERLEMLEV